jgi:hypothetical protein
MTCPYGHPECEGFGPVQLHGTTIHCAKTFGCAVCGRPMPWEMGCDDDEDGDHWEEPSDTDWSLACDECWSVAHPNGEEAA